MSEDSSPETLKPRIVHPEDLGHVAGYLASIKVDSAGTDETCQIQADSEQT